MTDELMFLKQSKQARPYHLADGILLLICNT
jgi:hypothetical protein